MSAAKPNRRLVQDPKGNVFSIRPEVKLKTGWSLWAPLVKPAAPAPAPKPIAQPAPPPPKAKD